MMLLNAAAIANGSAAPKASPIAAPSDDSIGGAVAAVRQPQAVAPAHETAGHQQAGRAQRLVAHDHPGTERQPTRELVRLVLDGGGDLDGGVADGQTSAGLEIKPRQE